MDQFNILIMDRLLAALNRIADAQEKQAEATFLLARATAGEFDEAPTLLEPSPKGQGMGMQG